MKIYITTIKNYKCINIENIYSYEHLTKNKKGFMINESNFINCIINNNITLYYNNKFIKGNKQLKPEITISRNKNYLQFINKKTNNFLFPINNQLSINSGLYCITKSFITFLLNPNSLFYPYVFSYNEYNIFKNKKIFLHEQTTNKDWYNWKTEEEVKNLKLKYFPEHSFVVCICGRISINSYPKSLLEAIKRLRNSGLNIYLLILGEVKVSPHRLTPNLYKELKSYNWIKSFTVDKKEILNYFRFCDVLASTYRDFCNHVGGSNKIKEYLLCDKPILCSRGKERENELGKHYQGFYDCSTCNTVPPLCWTKEFLNNPMSYLKQYNRYFYNEDVNGGNLSEINNIMIYLDNIFKKDNIFYYTNKYFKKCESDIIKNKIYKSDILLLTKNDWSNTAYRFLKSLELKNINTVGIKFKSHIFNYKNQLPIANVPFTDLSKSPVIININDKNFIKLLLSLCETVKYIWFHASTMIYLNNKPLNSYLKNKKYIVSHGGTTYRENPELVGNFFNDFVDYTLIQCPDLLDLNSKVLNEKLIYYPVSLNQFNCNHNFKNKDKLVFGHNPSTSKIKGTERILNVIKKFNNRLIYNGQLKQYETHNLETERIPWDKQILKYQNYDIYIETLNPSINNKPYGEWGNTCLEAIASGCLVITNCIHLNKYIKYYKNNPPLIIANNETELYNEIDKLLSMDSEEILNLKIKQYEWVKKYHSLDDCGRRICNFLNIQEINEVVFDKNTFYITIVGNINENNFPNNISKAVTKIKTTTNYDIKLLFLTTERKSYTYLKSLNSDFIVIYKTNKYYFDYYYNLSHILIDITENCYLNDFKKFNKHIIAKVSKLTKSLFGSDYIGLYNDKKQYKFQVIDIAIIIYYYILINDKNVYDIGILTAYDWCNTGYRYTQGLKENNVSSNMIKIFNHTCFNYGKQYFFIFNNKNESNNYIDISKNNELYYHIKIKNINLNKLFIAFIDKCKTIYSHAETYIELNNYDYLNKYFIVGAAGHAYRRQPKLFANFFNSKINKSLIQCPDLLDLGVINDNLLYYGVDNKKLNNLKETKTKLTIGHFSSNPETKGSDIILKCISIITNKYPKRFVNYNNLDISEYNKYNHHEKNWENNILRYRDCDIYIETCKPYLNKYSCFTEYNNTKYGEWGNTCLEAAASGCIVITNSLTKDRYLKDYDYEYPLLIANSEEEILVHLENLYKMTNEEITELKKNFLLWVDKKHSLFQTGKRFKNTFLSDVNSYINPSGYLFNKFDFHINQYISFVYLNNKKNNLVFEVSKNLLNSKFVIGSMEGNIMYFDYLTNIKKLNSYDNIIEHSKNNENCVFDITLISKPYNFIIYILNNTNKEKCTIINKNNDKNLILRYENSKINNITQLKNNEIIKETNIDNLFNKEHYKLKNKTEKSKMDFLDNVVLKNVL